jgi:antitoxin (DNA-binding transcriptional repressor) of toxin-antitoxin stability system
VNPFILSAHIAELIQLQNETTFSINLQIKRPQMEVSSSDSTAHLSRYLAQARQGTTLEITCHRRVIRRVTGVPESGTPALGELIAKGAAQWDDNKPRARTSCSPRAELQCPHRAGRSRITRS